MGVGIVFNLDLKAFSLTSLILTPGCPAIVTRVLLKYIFYDNDAYNPINSYLQRFIEIFPQWCHLSE